MDDIYVTNPIMNDDNDIQLDYPIVKARETLDDVIEQYAEKMESLEANVGENSMDSIILLTRIICNPFILTLLIYLFLVFFQIIFVSRSALRGKIRSLLNQPRRIQLLAFSALISLGATWYNMILYLFWSYDAFLKRIQLTGDEIPSVPICTIQTTKDFDCILAKSIAYSLRMQQWLRSTSLFKESWLYVVGSDLNWWWSVEVCMFTVGVWASFVRVQGKRFNIPHLWLYMLLGQTCSISVAQNLFSLALAVNGLPDSSRTGRQSNVTHAGLDADLIPPPSSPAGKRTKKATVQAVARPSTFSRLFTFCLTILGLTTVFLIPSDFRSILIMHALPFALVLPIAHSQFNFLPLAIDKYLQLSTLYASLAFVSLFIRLQTHFSVFSKSEMIQANMSKLFLSSLAHPAQSSISADAVCIGLSVLLDLYYQQASGVIQTMYAWSLIVLTPFLGPSTTFAISLAIREAQLEEISYTAEMEDNPATPVKSLTSSSNTKGSKSKINPSSKSTIKRSTSTNSLQSARSSKSKFPKKGNDSSDDDSDMVIDTPSKPSRRKSTIKSAGKETPVRKKRSSLKSGKASDVEQSENDGPAARAKRTRARPRNQEMMDGEKLMVAEEVASGKSARTPKRTPSTRGRGRGRSTGKRGE